MTTVKETLLFKVGLFRLTVWEAWGNNPLAKIFYKEHSSDAVLIFYVLNKFHFKIHFSNALMMYTAMWFKKQKQRFQPTVPRNM